MSGFTDRIIASMAGGLVVSCQAYPGEPLRHPETMAQMAAAVEAGGAVAVRAQGLSDVCAMHAACQLPGLTSSPSTAPDANVPTG